MVGCYAVSVDCKYREQIFGLGFRVLGFRVLGFRV